MSYQVKDSGQRRDFGTGAVRDMGEGKGRTDLLPFFALLELAKHFEAGAAKYAAENWRKGIPLRVYLDSAIRHLFKFALGMRDERHDLAALWNVACLIETQHMIDRDILPADLANLPNWYDGDDGGDAFEAQTWGEPVITADDIAGMPLAGVLPGAYGCDDSDAAVEARIVALGGVPAVNLYDDPAADGPMTTAEMNDFLGIPEVGEDVKDLDDWLGNPAPKFTSGLNYGWVTDGPVPVQIVEHAPLDLRPQDREYTRGHAEDTAARFNSGLPYADHTTPTEDATMSFIGGPLIVKDAPPLPTPDLLAQVVEGMAADAIADNPLFAVAIINGTDAYGYDGPEVKCALDGCGCKAPPTDTDPLEGTAYVIVAPADRGILRAGDERRWMTVEDGRVLFKMVDASGWTYSTSYRRDEIRLGIKAGNFIIVEAGLEPA